MKQLKVLLNASNLHVGGGVQVATSVISEFALMKELPENLTIWASTEVDDNLKSLGYDLKALTSYKVVNTYGMKFIFSPLRAQLQKFDRVFTVFGPLYSLFNKPYSIVGFAQPWIIYPENDVLCDFSFYDRWLNKLKFSLQRFFFSQADRAIVELEHVAEGLIREKIIDPEKIEIIYNCINNVFLEESRWANLPKKFESNKLKLGFVGRNYTHKNTKIFPEVVRLLYERFNIKSNFYVTFTDDEWRLCSEDFKRHVTNVGVLSASQCPMFYKSIDAVIFPSLLECFSATPLESMVMEKPLFVSERPFNRDLCKEHAFYFDPLNPEDAAQKIAAYFGGEQDNSIKEKNLIEARRYALNFSNAKERAMKYLQCLTFDN